MRGILAMILFALASVFGAVALIIAVEDFLSFNWVLPLLIFIVLFILNIGVTEKWANEEKEATEY